MKEAVIALKGVKKNYGKHEVLRDVNLQVNRGDIYGLVGKNGAGKSTIFKVILGLSEYQGGELQIEGENSRKGIEKGRKKIGFLVGTNFFSYMNARQNLEYYRRLKGISDRKEVERVLKLVELDQAKGPFKNYSLGMRQRLGIANAILGNPEILILDEPTNGLDPKGIADVRNLVKRLNEEYGMTVIISSHILGELQHTAHRFGIVNEGRIVREISTEDLKKETKTVKIAVDDLEKAEAVLKENGITVMDVAQESYSLEDYYFHLVGGEENV